MKILVLGDSHIPSRAREIPRRMMDKIRECRFDLILCTGDLTEEGVLENLRKIAPIKWVVGNMDYLDGPLEEEVSVGPFKIGLIHGTDIHPRGDVNQLYRKATEMGVNVLVSGHTHSLSLHLEKGTLLLNPGSVTGVWGGGPASLKPSFIILDVRGDNLKTEYFELREGSLFRGEILFKKTSKGDLVAI